MLAEIVTGQALVVAEWYGFPTWLMWTCQIIIIIATCIGLYKIIGKTGEKAWKGLIPGYNIYLQYKLTWRTRYFWLALLLLIAQVVAWELGTPLWGNYVYHVSFIAIDLALTIVLIIGYLRLIQAFDCETGMIIGFILFEALFFLILGFGKKKYQGNIYLMNYERNKKEKAERAAKDKENSKPADEAKTDDNTNPADKAPETKDAKPADKAKTTKKAEPADKTEKDENKKPEGEK